MLLLFEFFANRIGDNFVPIDLGSRDGELSTECFEGGLRHGLVVLANGRLVLVLGPLDHLNQFARGLLFSLVREKKNYTGPSLIRSLFTTGGVRLGS